MHYFVTGHTGFKGAWLVLLLTESGHTVSGLSLDPEPGCLFDRAGIADRMALDFRRDVRDPGALRSALHEAGPDVVIHLAAQPLVRESYREPRRTVETNVLGTYNVLEAVSHTDTVKAQVIITTDKVYRNVDRVEGYREDEPLGGDDLYSVSKAMADLLVQAWVHSFPGPPTAVARAGNVIGGGDSSKDRLLPDVLRAFASGQPAVIRYPNAVRPWQHVLDCLSGYLLLTDAVLAGEASGSWNFGPADESFASVEQIAQRTAAFWGPSAHVVVGTEPEPHEAGLLTLDSTKARGELDWSDRLSLDQALEWTVSWTKAVQAGEPPRDVALKQLRAFASLK